MTRPFGATEDDDHIEGIFLEETIIGYDWLDAFGNGGGNDWLEGHGGNDYILGGGGDDLLDGGEYGADSNRSMDTASYEGSAGGVKIDLVAGTGRGGDAEGDTLIGIENVIGSTHDDTVIASADANRIDGGAGRDKADYSRSPAGVTVDLSGVPGAGGDAEGDV
ncbi:hypothetical protein KXS07_35800, partial [Inquilinus limosus]